MDTNFPELVVQRFWDKVEPDDSGCMIWGGARTSTGYGRYSVRDATGSHVNYRAHRFSWMITYHEEIPRNREICHTCDVRLCVNPNHLFVGTHRENMLDAQAKGRLAVPEPPQRGKGRKKREKRMPSVIDDTLPSIDEIVLTPRDYGPPDLEDFGNDEAGQEDRDRGDGWRWEELFD